VVLWFLLGYVIQGVGTLVGWFGFVFFSRCGPVVRWSGNFLWFLLRLLLAFGLPAAVVFALRHLLRVVVVVPCGGAYSVVPRG